MPKTTNLEPLLQGESALDNAPHTTLQDGSLCIPQHYLSYQHSKASVEALVMKISYSDKYPIFVTEEDKHIVIQIGIIGYDNYQPLENQPHAKIVYGRKWRVEPNLPTSEIIQTVFLAIKKAREHEIRELMRLNINHVMTTPFNSHHDAPLIARSVKEKHPVSEANELSKNALQQILNDIEYDGNKFELNHLERRDSGQWLVELQIQQQSSSQLNELKHRQVINYFIDRLTINHCLHGLMTALIQLSDRHVEEHFLYDGVARFSWDLDLMEIARLSADTRRLHLDADKQSFSHRWRQMNYMTDETRVPLITHSPLAEKLKTLLHQFGPLEGVLPKFN